MRLSQPIAASSCECPYWPPLGSALGDSTVSLPNLHLQHARECRRAFGRSLVKHPAMLALYPYLDVFSI